jgi:hypothetical protein
MSDVGVIVAGALVGSVSGVAGAILGAWVSGKSALAGLKLTIEAEKESARLADKRAVYAQCLASLDNCKHSLQQLRQQRGTAESAAAAQKYDRAWQDCAAKVNELGLVAPDGVRFVALTASGRLYRLAELADSSHDEFRGAEVRYFKAEDCLREALRADLGMPPGLDLEAMIEELSSDDQRDPAPETIEPAGS